MAISRLQASLAAATNEVTVAAANINFDFTLVKCEAPKEYQGLGTILSKNRKESAELGSAHITARKLGALFKGVCPETPRLIKAYGTRASEIAAAARNTCCEPSDGIFAGHTGVDGTSIWAAATSSSTALHVQLLACMLARVWNASEATSIWFELIQERRRGIAAQFESGEQLPFSDLTAATQSEISRSSLAEWDSSARSWLRTADRMKMKEQKQLMLIIPQTNASISKDTAVLSSVIAAWKSALTTMENLICGMPQAVSSGASLLGLLSWHIYPDILEAGHGPIQVRFHDQVVCPGGTITLGLENVGNKDRQGVHWSLSLAYLTFYGPPISTEAHLHQDSARVSFSHFTQAVLGCLFGSWSVSGHQIEYAARFIVSIQTAIARTVGDASENVESREQALGFLRDSTHWFNVMAQAAQSYLDTENEERDVFGRLVKMGLRHWSQFSPEKDRKPYFGLYDSQAIINFLKGPEERVTYLRFVASSSCVTSHNPIIIRYKTAIQSGLVGKNDYATAVPLPLNERKRKRDPQVQTESEQARTIRHHRWVQVESYKDYPGEEVHIMEDTSKAGNTLEPTYSNTQLNQWSGYTWVYGDPDVAEIIINGSSRDINIAPESPEHFLWCLNRNMVSIDRLLYHVMTGRSLRSGLLKNMRAMSTASKIYKALPNATLSVATLSQNLAQTSWARAMEAPEENVNQRATCSFNRRTAILTRSIALSCVAYMESGADINPNLLDRVMALAYEDSLYIAMQLTCDPFESIEPYELKLALGNVGRPGLTLLVPPEKPVMRQSNPESWKFISNNEFNGRDEDHFGKTSLHLSFTGYYVPLYQDSVHRRDSQIFILESVVSVYNAGLWIGDVDVLRALSDKRVKRMPKCKDSMHSSPTSGHDMGKMISIEGWDDILDPPKETFIVRASGNWLARLAAVAIVAQLMKDRDRCDELIICPSRGACWVCNRGIWSSELIKDEAQLRKFSRGLFY